MSLRSAQRSAATNCESWTGLPRVLKRKGSLASERSAHCRSSPAHCSATRLGTTLAWRCPGQSYRETPTKCRPARIRYARLAENSRSGRPHVTDRTRRNRATGPSRQIRHNQTARAIRPTMGRMDRKGRWETSLLIRNQNRFRHQTHRHTRRKIRRQATRSAGRSRHRQARATKPIHCYMRTSAHSDKEPSPKARTRPTSSPNTVPRPSCHRGKEPNPLGSFGTHTWP